MPSYAGRANVIGAGPNGLSAAIVLAQNGWDVQVFEASDAPGGAARTLPLTLPGFLHDVGSAVHPLAASSPFFNSLPLASRGLSFIYADAPLAHPLDDGSAVMLEHDIVHTAQGLGHDGGAWRALLQPLVSRWHDFLSDALQPPLRIPNHPLLMAAFARDAFQPAMTLATLNFRGERASALFAGLAAHSFLALDRPLSSAIALVLAAAAHADGWPIPHGGAQGITDALVAQLHSLRGSIRTNRHVNSLRELSRVNLTMCDVAPRQLDRIAGPRLSPPFREKLRSFQYGPAAFKVDYALSAPVPWRAPECARAITVHLGGSMEDIAQAEHATNCDRMPERPFVLVSQPSLFDPSRAPEGKHVLWAYCHVPHGYPHDATAAMEAQIERFAPGFRDCVLARHVSSPAELQRQNENLVGGDIQGGLLTPSQLFARPTIRDYATSARDIYICSASTAPGGGVHGMCGANAARMALRRFS